MTAYKVTFYNRLNQISIPSWQSRGTLAEYQIKTCHSDLLYRMHFTQIVKEEGADSFIKNNRSLVFFYTSQVCNRDISFLILNYKATGIITLLPFYSLIKTKSMFKAYLLRTNN